MSKESLEESRNRLLRKPEIQHMIRMRAYEIYQIRGREPGYQAEDWFRAEGEILQFLIEGESRREAESDEVEAKPARGASAASATGATARNSIEEPPNATANAESRASLDVWSVTEPQRATLAPPVGNATEFQIDAPKKSRSRASSKSSAPRKIKGDDESHAKKTTRRATAKKDTDSPGKPKRTRKKPEERTPVGNE